MATLGDLVTVVYRPRETMHRILGDRDRWSAQVVILAFLCASVHDVDATHLTRVLPGLGFSAIAIVALGFVLGAAGWVVVLFLMSWIATVVGRKMGGVASAADVRAALAWGMVPVIWSLIYRIPFAVLESRLSTPTDPNPTLHVLDILAHGGCSLFVVFLTFQILFMAWSLFVGSSCLAEAQQFSSAKGFLNVVIAIAVPVVVIAAAVVARRFAT
jgi:Yip1 domain